MPGRQQQHPWLRIELAIRAVLADRLTRGASERVDQVLMARVMEREQIERVGGRHLLVAGLVSLLSPLLLLAAATGDTRLQSAAPQDLSIQDSISHRPRQRAILIHQR